jgi:hypothetical protein
VLVVGAFTTASFPPFAPPFSACANVSLIGGNFTARPLDPNTDPNNPLPLFEVVVVLSTTFSAGFAAALYAALHALVVVPTIRRRACCIIVESRKSKVVVH